MPIDVRVNGSNNQVLVADRDLHNGHLLTPSLRPPASVSGLRKLGAQYWQRVIGMAAGVYGTLTVVSFKVASVPFVPSSSVGRWAAIGSAVMVLLLIRHPRVAYGVVRWLVPVEAPPEDRRGFRGLLPYTEGEKIPGRAHEVEQCRVLQQRGRFVVLDGETGCGKSSVLSAALLPAIRESARVVEVRVGEKPFHSLYRALSTDPVPAQIGRAQILDLLARFSAPTETRPLVIVIDQFEELFVLAREGVRRRFAVTLRDVVESGAARVLVALRSDFLDLLVKLLREVDPVQRTLNLSAWFTLKAFRETVACEVVQEILAEVIGDDALLEHEIRLLSKTLAHDLLRAPRDARLSPLDPWTVLPVELQSVGLMLQLAGTRNLSTDGYRRLGGRAGLMRALIEDAKRFVRLSTGVDGDTTLLLLREFMSSAGTRQPRTVAELKNAKALAAIPDKQVRSMLKALEQRFLVKRIALHVQGYNDSTVAYELVHEYLVRILHDAPDPFLQKARDAQERLQFWLTRAHSTRETRGRFARIFDQPIPLAESLRLRRFASSHEARRMLNANLAACASRLAVVILPLLLAASVGWAWWSTEEHQAELAIRDGRAATLKLPSQIQYNALTPWMVVLAQAGRTDEAVLASEVVQDPELRSVLLASTADTLLSKGNFLASAELLRAALKAGFSSTRSDASAELMRAAWTGRFILTRSDSTLILARTAEALARNGRSLAGSQLPETGSTPISRATGFAAVALGLARAGYHDLAIQALRKAREVCADVPGAASRVAALILIIRVAELTKSPAEAQAAASDLWVAAPLVEDEEQRFSALMANAAASARQGDAVRARAAFEAGLADLPETWSRNRNMEIAVRDLTRSGHLSWTVQTLRELPKAWISAHIRTGAAVGLAEADQVDSALSLVPLLDRQGQKNEALIAISMVLLRNHQSLAPARSVIARMKTPDTRSWMSSQNELMSLIDTLIAAGDPGTALGLASHLSDHRGQRVFYGPSSPSRSNALANVAVGYAANGLADSAVRVVQIIPDSISRCSAVIGIASHLLSRGDSRGTGKALLECRPSPSDGEMTKHLYRAQFIATLLVSGNALLNSSRLDSIATPAPDSIFGYAVGILSDSGKIAPARGLLRRIRDERFRSPALAKVIHVLARADSGVAALRLADGINPERYPAQRSHACGEIASWHARARRMLEARRLARDCHPADALKSYTEILRQHGTPPRTRRSAMKSLGYIGR